MRFGTCLLMPGLDKLSPHAGKLSLAGRRLQERLLNLALERLEVGKTSCNLFLRELRLGLPRLCLRKCSCQMLAALLGSCKLLLEGSLALLLCCKLLAQRLVFLGLLRFGALADILRFSAGTLCLLELCFRLSERFLEKRLLGLRLSEPGLCCRLVAPGALSLLRCALRLLAEALDLVLEPRILVQGIAEKIDDSRRFKSASALRRSSDTHFLVLAMLLLCLLAALRIERALFLLHGTTFHVSLLYSSRSVSSIDRSNPFCFRVPHTDKAVSHISAGSCMCNACLWLQDGRIPSCSSAAERIVMQILVFDIGGTAIKWSLRDEAGKALKQDIFSTPKDSADAFLSSLMDIVKLHGSQASGIAISAPGVIEHHRFMRTGGALTYAYGLPLADRLKKLSGLPVTIGNDGKCAALAELSSGTLKGTQNSCTLILGTGLGGGLVVDGKVLAGPHGSAGELSQLSFDFGPDGTIGSCAGMDASTSGLIRTMRSACGKTAEELPDGKACFRLLESGNPAARQAFESWCMAVATVIFDLAAMLDIERCAIGGGISANPHVLEGIKTALARVSEKLPHISGQTTITLPEVVPCRYGAEANQLGALALFLESRKDR